MNKKLVIECENNDKLTEVYQQAKELCGNTANSKVTVEVQWFGVQISFYESDNIDTFATRIIKAVSNKGFTSMINTTRSPGGFQYPGDNVMMCSSETI